MTIRGFVLLSAAAVRWPAAPRHRWRQRLSRQQRRARAAPPRVRHRHPRPRPHRRRSRRRPLAEQEYVDRYTTGDRDGAYELLANEIRTNIPQATWVEIVNTCNTKAALHSTRRACAWTGEDKPSCGSALARSAPPRGRWSTEDGVWHPRRRHGRQDLVRQVGRRGHRRAQGEV